MFIESNFTLSNLKNVILAQGLNLSNNNLKKKTVVGMKQRLQTINNGS